MAGSKATRHIRALISLMLIIAVYFLDDRYFGPLSGNVFWAAHVYLHKVLAMIITGLIGAYTYVAHPATWTLTLWISIYTMTIAGLILVKIIFLFVSDPYHLQVHALDFAQRYMFSILPFLGLYVLAEILRPVVNNEG
ncbi:MAG: hypothetical protein JSS96_03005 [Bacteroidetes bacterium]|nr:hypothetical protein [Bacteroidota bacterium]